MNSFILMHFIVQPKLVQEWSTEQWNQFLQQSYVTNLTARVYYILKENQLIDFIPKAMRWHFLSAEKVFLAHQHDILNEALHIVKALKLSDIEPVFLKGTAYLLANDKCHYGRLFSDVDIFVPKEQIKATEQMLSWNGWINEELTEHDEKYYRNWMHEIPPMINTKTNMTIDVHHNLIPLVSRIKLNSNLLLSKVETQGRYNVLAREDRVLHSAAHLLLDGEFKHGFRDLHDLYSLVTEGIEQKSAFLSLLHARAKQLGFELILYYCLSLLIDFFELKVNANIMQECEQSLSSPLIAKQVLQMFKRVLQPNEKLANSIKYKTSLQLLFIRSHWLKMPMHILLPHLFHKAFITPYIAWKKNQELQKPNNS